MSKAKPFTEYVKAFGAVLDDWEAYWSERPEADLHAMNEHARLERAFQAGQSAAKVLEERTKERYYLWAYRLCVAFAKHLLTDASAAAEAGDWPDGLEWSGCVGTSRSVFMQEARDLAGITHNDFLEPVRADFYDVLDLWNGDLA